MILIIIRGRLRLKKSVAATRSNTSVHISYLRWCDAGADMLQNRLRKNATLSPVT